MKYYQVFLIMLTPILCLSQNEDPSKHRHIFNEIKKDRISSYLDSLTARIYADTTHFSREHLIHTAGGTFNTETRSALFIVEEKYFYKVDILENYQVVEFVKHALDPKKIKSLGFLEKELAKALYGTHGDNGVVLLTLKKNAHFNPEIAGLRLDKNRNTGNNFDQRKKDELIIRH